MRYVLYKNQQNTKPFQFNGSFVIKGAICYVATSHLVFHWWLFYNVSYYIIVHQELSKYLATILSLSLPVLNSQFFFVRPHLVEFSQCFEAGFRYQIPDVQQWIFNYDLEWLMKSNSAQVHVERCVQPLVKPQSRIVKDIELGDI